VSALLEADAALNALNPTPFPLPLGPLAPVVEGAMLGFGRKGWVVTGPRERVGAVLRGCPVERLVDGLAGARPYRLAPCSVAPGNRALHAVGLAMASGEPVLCVLGLASAASGAFHEALNLAALCGAPVIFVVAVLAIGPDAPVGPQLAGSPAAIATTMGLGAVRVYGVVEAVQAAVAEARAAGGPRLVEATTTANSNRE